MWLGYSGDDDKAVNGPSLNQIARRLYNETDGGRSHSINTTAQPRTNRDHALDVKKLACGECLESGRRSEYDLRAQQVRVVHREMVRIVSVAKSATKFSS